MDACAPNYYNLYVCICIDKLPPIKMQKFCLKIIQFTVIYKLYSTFNFINEHRLYLL